MDLLLDNLILFVLSTIIICGVVGVGIGLFMLIGLWSLPYQLFAAFSVVQYTLLILGTFEII